MGTKCVLFVSSLMMSSCAPGPQLLLDGVADYLPCPLDVPNYALDADKGEERVELVSSKNGVLGRSECSGAMVLVLALVLAFTTVVVCGWDLLQGVCF
jgi:hypothetical protein